MKLKQMRNSTDDNFIGGLRVKQNRLILTQTYQHGQSHLTDMLCLLKPPKQIG